jgi:hypothetical protein
MSIETYFIDVRCMMEEGRCMMEEGRVGAIITSK